MVRLDLASVADGTAAGADPAQREVTHRIVMTPEAFARSLRMMEDLLGKMNEAGVFKQPPEKDDAKPVYQATPRKNPMH
jgi:hypothetical protein